MIETEKYYIIKTNIKQYTYIVFSKGTNVLDDFKDIVKHFDNENKDYTKKALFDQLVFTGLNNNRFIEMQYEDNEFIISSINVRDNIKNKRAIKQIKDFYAEHLELIDRCSAMGNLDKALYKEKIQK